MDRAIICHLASPAHWVSAPRHRNTTGIMRPNPVIKAGSSSKKRWLSKVITLEDDEDEDEDEDEVVEEEDGDFNM
ncbi:BZ3500_MvSof-1268-A1-R1_Chr9g10309 [Microbotryum saponariae]|uniref:BZ3500_MvSof-1268-A1-R1_Chr9g10309 protein n=1 Tax=Microbotryum saponariae TaxID=289078 RepID=A0A2X0KEG9_9BASI|nr:BZ3501_MvSof-1269-A2-R1_Chr9g10059 [Microbotryum saponariae]SCZ99889.1 BZ3500_MvSof-1268-A1-R1_Chr9g10309 [Microbotryum saponariae]